MPTIAGAPAEARWQRFYTGDPMFSKQLLQSSTVRLTLIAMVLCGITLVSGQSSGVTKAAPEQGFMFANALDANLPNANASTNLVGHICRPKMVGFVSNLVVVECDVPAANNISFFAVPITNGNAKVHLSILLTAQAIGGQVNLGYEPDDTSLHPGCDASNCRPLFNTRSVSP
jgi:hypothetical protein